jgi:hypothetical protein
VHLFSGQSQRYSLKEDSCLSSSHGERALREPSTKRLSLTCSSLPPTSTPHQTLVLLPNRRRQPLYFYFPFPNQTGGQVSDISEKVSGSTEHLCRSIVVGPSSPATSVYLRPP